jgi:hypothetical protein
MIKTRWISMFSHLKMVLDAYRPFVRKMDVDKEIVLAVSENLEKLLALETFLARGDHSLLYFAYTCVRDLFIRGVIYLAKKIIR